METVGAYEAKTHLPKLLERVRQGEFFTITKHGVPVAILSPPDPQSVKDVESVIADLRRFRKDHRLDGLTVREMVEDGRR